MTVGANRIVPAVSIPHPLGNPELAAKDEYALRRRITKTAVDALAQEVTKQTIFE